MAQFYKLYKSNRKNSPMNGMIYARAAWPKTLTTDMLADQIEAATTLTRTDVVACIEAFLQYIREGLLNGQRVNLRRFGTFKVGIASKPASSYATFSVAKNIKGVRVIFQPAVYTDNKHRVKSLIAGIKLQEMPAYAPDKKKDEEDPNP